MPTTTNGTATILSTSVIDRIVQLGCVVGGLLCLTLVVGFSLTILSMGYPATVLVPVMIVIILTGVLALIAMGVMFYRVQQDINYDNRKGIK